ncbi:MAG TPA: TadE family protein [Steroidobacteraceae bacterium]
MRTTPNLQRGQAMSEFVAAMALFLPLVLGVIYLGKYADMKHQAIQASRYAALERALDPHSTHENNQIIQNETVARFFRDGSQHSIGINDQAQGQTRTDANPLWSQLDGTPMLAQYSDVNVTLRNNGASLSTAVDAVAGRFKGLGTGSAIEADVEVSVAPITSFAPLNRIFRIGATTVMAGDPWNGDGAADVAGRLTQEAVPARNPAVEALTLLLTPLTTPLTSAEPPQFGCVKPEIVPNKEAGIGAPGAPYNPLNDPTNPNPPDDFCYR